MRILITGANGHIGRRLIARLVATDAVTAVVRSSAAAQQLAGSGADVAVVDYADVEALAAAAQGCDRVVHLVGILKESTTSRYVDAHESGTAALLEAVQHLAIVQIVYVSILGADPRSRNACLASKGRAERLLLDSGIPALILRVPMVLGEHDHASRALARMARGPLTVLIRGASLEQPIYAGDLVDAIVAGLRRADGSIAIDLAGPESLPRAALVERAAVQCGYDAPRCISVPLAPALWIAAAIEWLGRRLGREPPVTRAMLGVLDHDDRIDAAAAAAQLGISLTGLDDMLRRCLTVRRHLGGDTT